MNLGILVGHYGPGTGASFGGRDEWFMAVQDAVGLAMNVHHKLGFQPDIIRIDRSHPQWKAVGEAFALAGGLSANDKEIRARWAKWCDVDTVLELHYNSSVSPAEGFEVLIDDNEQPGSKAEQLALALCEEFHKEWPDRPNRGVKRMRLEVLERCRRFATAVLVEPAFLCEKCLDDDKLWRAKYIDAMTRALVRHYETT